MSLALARSLLRGSRSKAASRRLLKPFGVAGCGFVSKRFQGKYVVVGGVAGGATACTRLRRNCESSEIIMLERGPFVSFANCGLPYYVGDMITDEQKLLQATPELFRDRFKMDVRTNSTVTKINKDNNSVTVQTADGSEYTESFDKLVIAVGAAPIYPPVDGLHLPGVFSVRTIADSRNIREHMETNCAEASKKRCVVVGGGFIGLEMAENMVERGFDVSILDALPQVMGVCDAEMVAPFHRVLRAKGVKLVLGDMLSNISEEGDGAPLHVNTASGNSLAADIVLLGLGVLPENQLAKDANLPLGVKGSFAVDSQMRTPHPDIFAVGDCVETFNAITGLNTNLALAGPAQQQARLVADVITDVAGIDEAFRGVQGSSICGIFGQALACTGLSQKALEMFGPSDLRENAVAVYLHSGHHADFYPGAEMVHMKLLFDKRNGEVLGAQCAGSKGVVKMMDTIAAFVQMRATVDDLAHAELCYAPAYGSARGPVNNAGQIAQNIMKGLESPFEWNSVFADDCDTVLLDVRDPHEIDKFPITLQPSSKLEAADRIVSIPLNELRERHSVELKRFKENGTKIATTCQVGKRGYLAARILKQLGYDAKNASGGYLTYKMFCEANSEC